MCNVSSIELGDILSVLVSVDKLRGVSGASGECQCMMKTLLSCKTNVKKYTGDYLPMGDLCDLAKYWQTVRQIFMTIFIPIVRARLLS